MRSLLLARSLTLLAGAVCVTLPARVRAQDSTTNALQHVVWQKPYVLDLVVGVVGDHPILWSDVLLGIGARLRGQPIPPDTAEQLKLAQEVLGDIVDQEVLVQRAQRDTAIHVAETDVNGQVDGAMKRIRDQFRTEGEFRDALRKEGLGTPEDYRKKLVDDAKRAQFQKELIQKLRRDGKLLPGLVNEAEVTAAYQKTRAQLPKRPATVGFHQIVFAPRAGDKARAVAFARLDSIAGELAKDLTRFESVAKSVSQDPGSREQGGDLGWNRRGQMVPAFDRVMFALPPNTLSPIVETPFGFHLIKVERVLPAEVKARHILIRPVVDSVDVARARHAADSIAGVWRRGGSYDSLSLAWHDPREERGSATPFVRDSLPEPYQKAMADAKTGDVVGPFTIVDTRTSLPKFVLVQVLSLTTEGEFTREEYKEKMREQLAEEKSYRRLIDQLKKESFVSTRLAALPAPLK